MPDIDVIHRTSLAITTYRRTVDSRDLDYAPRVGHIYTYKRVVCVCLSVGLLVCFLSATRHLSTLWRCLRVAESRVSRRSERPRARGQAHAQREHARAWRTTSQRKNRCADAFQKQNRTRAHAVVYVTAEIFKKKGNRKPTCHFPSSVYSLPSLGVFTFRIVHILISDFKQNYWQEETSYLIFGRSRPWSARLYL